MQCPRISVFLSSEASITVVAHSDAMCSVQENHEFAGNVLEALVDLNGKTIITS
jgi:hypothetical protein